MPELTKADLPEIIQRYRNGESMLTIAAETPVKARQLYNWIIQDQGPEYEQIQTECLINRIADCDMKLEQARDPVQVARAREQARFARFDLERRRPSLYGPKQELKTDTSLTITVVRQPAQGQILEGQARLIEGPGSTPTDGGGEREPHA